MREAEAGMIELASAGQIIEAVDNALQIEGPRARVESMLRSLQGLFQRPGLLCVCRVWSSWSVEPTLLTTIYVGHFPGTEQQLHEWYHKLPIYFADVADDFVPKIFEAPRVPIVAIFPEDFQSPKARDSKFGQLHESIGFEQSILGAWAGSPSQFIGVGAYRTRGTAPFTARDKHLLALMTRAIAALLVHDLFRTRDVLNRYNLTDRQTDVLHLLLGGLSEKEIAESLHRSTHTVHAHIKQIYEHVQVNSRSELLALFVDQAFATEPIERGEPA